MKQSVAKNKLAQRRRRWRFYAQGLNAKGQIPMKRYSRPVRVPAPVHRKQRLSELEQLWQALRATMAQPEVTQ